MDAENKQSDSGSKFLKQRTGVLKWMLLVVCAVVALLVFALPAYISSESFRELVVRKINESVSGRVEIGKLAVGWFEGVSLTGFSYIDRDGRLSISAKSVFTRPLYGSIVLGRPAFGRTIIEQPVVRIRLDEPPPAQSKSPKKDKKVGRRVKSSFLPIEQIELVINRGSVRIDSNEQSLQLSEIEAAIILNRAEPVKVQGKCEADYDLAVLSMIAAPFLPEGLKLEGKRKESIIFSTDYFPEQPDKFPANLNTAFSFGFDRAEYMGLKFGPTETKVEIKNGLLTIAPFSTSISDGRMNFAATVDLTQSPMLLKAAGPVDLFKNVRIDDRLGRKLLMYLNPIFADAVNVSGIAAFQCEKLVIPLGGGDKNDLEIAGTIAVNNLRLKASELFGQIVTLTGVGRQAAEITIRPTRFVLENGLLSYTDMQMDVGDNPVNFSGVIGLDGSLDMRVTLPYTIEGRTVRVGEEAEAARIRLPLKGTVKKPEIDTGKLIEEQLRYQLLQRLRKLLE